MAGSSASLIGVVEDSDADFWALDRVLSGTGEVRRWATGESAVEALAGAEPGPGEFTILFVDMHLPGVDGAEVVKRVRALPRGKEARIVMLSGSRDEDDIRRSFDAGADRYEFKPDTPAKLRLLVKRSLDGLYLRAVSGARTAPKPPTG